MKQAIADVRDFSDACSVYIKKNCDFPVQKIVDFRMELFDEESRELRKAVYQRDMVGVADGIADCIYVLIGTALAFGIPLDKVWNEVQRSNMAKRDPVTGVVLRRPDGKIIKPEGWEPPNIAAIIEEARNAELAA